MIVGEEIIHLLAAGLDLLDTGLANMTAAETTGATDEIDQGSVHETMDMPAETGGRVVGTTAGLGGGDRRMKGMIRRNG